MNWAHIPSLKAMVGGGKSKESFLKLVSAIWICI
jgi:hypothetical protein